VLTVKRHFVNAFIDEKFPSYFYYLLKMQLSKMKSHTGKDQASCQEGPQLNPSVTRPNCITSQASRKTSKIQINSNKKNINFSKDFRP